MVAAASSILKSFTAKMSGLRISEGEFTIPHALYTYIFHSLPKYTISVLSLTCFVNESAQWEIVGSILFFSYDENILPFFS